MKRTSILWITVLALGWLFDLLFWKQSPGINFTIYVLLCLGGGWLVLGRNGLKPAWQALLLLIPILFFAFSTFMRVEPLSLFLGFALTLGLMGLLALSYLGGRWPAYGLPDYVVHYAKLFGSMLARPLIFRSDRKKSAPATIPEEAAPGAPADSHSGRRRVWAVLRGLLIALPILAIFAALLASADLVFAEWLKTFTGWFRLANWSEYIFRLIYILISAYALAGVFLHAALKSRDESLLSEKVLVPPFLGFTEAAVVLGAVVALFAVFVGIQFRYFFGGGANIGVQGYTYSEYARRGFGELVTVAFFSLLLFLGLSAIARRPRPSQRRAFSGLGIGMVALVGVILVSAFRRLLLYEAAYGFSRLRIYTHVFMPWLGLLLAVVAALDLLRKERFFPLAALLALVGFAATLALINVDATIVRQNVARAPQGKGLDVAYLAALSPDSVPALAAAYQSPALPALTRDALGAVLVCRLQFAPAPKMGDGRSFNLSRSRADQIMASLQARLKAYQVSLSDSGSKILTPAHVYYECP